MIIQSRRLQRNDDETLALYHFSSGNVAQDSGDTGLDLTLVNFPANYFGEPSGYNGYGILFDGTRNASIGTNVFTNNNLVSGSVETAVFFPSIASGTLIDLEGAIRLSYNLASGAFEGFITDGATSGFVYTQSGVTQGTWHYVAFTWQSGGVSRIYHDGKNQGSGIFVQPNLNAVSRDSVIGARFDGTNKTNATLDEVRISSTSRPTEKIFGTYENERLLLNATVKKGMGHIGDSVSFTIYNFNDFFEDKYQNFDPLKIDYVARDREVSIDRRPIFSGRIENVVVERQTAGGGDTIKIEGRDYRAELTERFVLESYPSGTDTGFVVRDLIAKNSSNLTTSNVRNSGRTLQATRTFKGKTAYSEIRNLAKEDSFNFYVDIDNDAHYAPLSFVDSGITIQPGSQVILNVKPPLLGYELINKVTVFGATVGGSRISASLDDFTSQQTYGIIKEKFIIDENITSTGDAVSTAQSFLDQQATVSQIVEVTVIDHADISPGTILRFIYPNFKIDDQFVVIEKIHNFPSRETHLKLAGYRKETEDQVVKILDALNKLEAKDLAIDTPPKFLRFPETIKLKDVLRVYSRSVGDSWVVGDQDRARVGVRYATFDATTKRDFQEGFIDNVDTISSPGDVKLWPSGSSAGFTQTTQGDFESDQTSNIDTTTTTGSIYVASGVPSGVITSVGFDSGGADTGWTQLSWTVSLPSGTNVFFDARASNQQIGPASGTPAFQGVGINTSPANLNASGITGRYAEWRATLLRDSETVQFLQTSRSDFASGTQIDVDLNTTSGSVLIATSGGGGLDANAKAAYHFNEGTGSTYDDATGNGQHLTLINNATWTSSSKFGAYAASFPDISDRARRVGTNLNSVFAGTAQFTIEFFLYINQGSFSGDKAIFSTQDIDVNARQVVVYVLSTGKILFRGVYGGGSEVNLQSTNALPLQTWTHIELVRDATDIRIFIDGVANGSQTTSVSLNSLAQHTISLQHAPVEGDQGLVSRYDEMRISNVARHTTAFTPPTGEFGAGSTFLPSGALKSQTYDSGLDGVVWRTLDWSEINPNQTPDIRFEVRASDTPSGAGWQLEPSANFTSFSSGNAPLDLVSQNIQGRYFQWRATLLASGTAASPELQDVTASGHYNPTPRVDDVTITYGTNYNPSGYVESRVFDSGASGTPWSWVTWTETAPAGTNISVEARASNTLLTPGSMTPTYIKFPADDTFADIRGSGVVGQYAQWRAELTGGVNTPTLSSVSMHYGSGVIQPLVGEQGSAFTLIIEQ